jgi:CubicO group peptidase (beta-lactamase class C family)
MTSLPSPSQIMRGALRRIRVPEDLDAVTTFGDEEPARAGGMEAEAVERIWDAAVALYRSGVHPAVQVCVRREGRVVLDRVLGHARGNGPHDDEDAEKVLATTDTPFVVYSAAKAITAFVVHLLIDRGIVRLDAPVAEYIPGYEQNGKGDITVGHVLAHRAGVPNLPSEALELENIDDRELIVGLLCEAEPTAKPGEMLAYHAVSGGFILGEVVRRATGRDIRRVLTEEILDPLRFRWGNFGVTPDLVEDVGLSYTTGPVTAPPLSTLLTRALGVPLDELVETTNDPRFLGGIVPAANIVTTANELSRFYELMRRGGELDGVRIVQPATIRTALTEQSHLEFDNSLGFPTRFGYGLMLGARFLSLFGRDTQSAFGHLGFTNILGWADPERASAVAFITSGKPIIYPEMARFLGLAQRITSETPKAPASSRFV